VSGLNPIEITRSTVDGIAELWKRRGSFRSLCAFCFLLTIVITTLLSPVFVLLSKADLLSSPENLFTFAVLAISFWGLANVLLILAWLFWRRIPYISPGQIGVFFAPFAEPECEALIHNLYEQFQRDLMSRGLSTLITHSLVPRNHAFVNHNDAHKLLVQTGARLAIYGSVHRGKIRDKMVEGFRTISFAVRHRSLQSSERLPVARTFAGALALRPFTFTDSDSFIEKNIVIENMSDVACFFIAMALTLDENVDQAIPMLEQLLAAVNAKKKVKPRNPQLDLFSGSITDCLVYAFHEKLDEVYEKYLVDHITDRRFDRYAVMYESIITRIVEITRDAAKWMLSRAILEFHRGNIPEAKRQIAEAKNFFKNTNPGPYLSAAFLGLWEEAYTTAFREYIRASRCNDPDLKMIVGIIRFLSGIIEAYPEKQQIKFGLAFVNDWFFDKVAAKREYSAFLQETQRVEVKGFQLLREHARRRLLELNTEI
jgi:hypothetical protein